MPLFTDGMSIPVPPFRRLVLRTASAAAVIILIGYGLFEARRLIEGPLVSIESPRDGSAIAGPIIHITGTASNAAFLTINSAQAFVDENNRFDEALSPPPGYTVFTAQAKDRFGKITTKSVHFTIINYCPAHV